MKKYFVFILIIAAAASALSADANRIAVSDLAVKSDNPKLKYMGKGIAELIAYEMGKSKSVVIVEREKRTEMIKEMELSQTGLVDEAAQAKVGKMLAAKYIVFGDIIDMDKKMLISLRMVDVDTGQVVWREKLMEEISNYDYISGYFASSALRFANANVSESTTKKVEEKKAKNEDAAIAFSKAIDSYDKKNDAAAKTELEKVKALDPESTVADAYLAKLTTTSPKFKVELEKYAPSENPALLGLLKQDKIYFLASQTSWEKMGPTMDRLNDTWQTDEKNNVMHLGYAFPLGEKLGVAVEFIQGFQTSKVQNIQYQPFNIFGDTSDTFFNYQWNNTGGNISVGYALFKNFGLGGAFHCYYTADSGSLPKKLKSSMNYAGDIGFYIMGFDERIIFDTHFCMSTQDDYFLIEKDMKIVKGSYPKTIESTLTAAFFNKKLFLVLKGIGDIYDDARDGYIFRGIPLVEFWLFPFLSLRGGYEYTKLDLADKTASGSGFTAGTTVRVWKLDFDFNYTWRYRPIRVIPGYGINEGYALWSVTKHATFLER